jgi:AraC-like DNA-binding protein
MNDYHLFFRYYVIAGLINATIFSFLLLTYKKRSTAIILLVLLMIVISFQALLNAFDSRDFFLQFPNLFRVSWIQLSIIGPIIYLFTKKITSEHSGLQKKDVIHLVPFIVYSCVLFPWFATPTSIKRNLIQQYYDVLSQDDFSWLNQLSLILIIGYIIAALVHYKKYKEGIKNGFSDIEKQKFEFIKHFLYALLAIVLISGLVFYSRKLDIPFLTNFYHYNYIIVVAMVYWIAYNLLTRRSLFLQTAPLNSVAAKYKKSGLSEDALKSIYFTLLKYIDIHQPYLDPDLNIFKLAEELNVPRHHVSQAINTQSGKSFYDFINAYRVEEAKRRLQNPEYNNFTIQGYCH